MGIMFTSLMISFYTFLIGPQGKGPDVFVDPGGMLIQVISISGAPSLILAGIVFGLSRSYGERLAAIIIIITGIILIAGMLYLNTLAPKIDRQLRAPGMDVVPFIFIFGGIALLCLGGVLLQKSKSHNHSIGDYNIEGD
jgi:hypothetical protein